MKKCLIIMTIFIFIAGCGQKTLSLPALDANKLLITHIKEPILAVIDTTKNEVIHHEQFNFSVQSLTKIGDHQVALAGKYEKEVLLLNLTNGNMRTLFSSGSGVTDLLYDAHSGILFLTDAIKNEVIFMDVSTETVIARIDVGGDPVAMDVYGDTLYVLNDDDATISVIEISTNRLLRTFPVLERPTDLVATSEYVWVGGHGSFSKLNEKVYVYEASTGNLVEKIKVGLMPIALFSDKSRDEIWVLSHGSNELHVIDTRSFAEKGKFPTGDNPYYLTADSHYMYVTALDGDKLTVVDRKNYVIKHEISLFSGPYGIVTGGEDE